MEYATFLGLLAGILTTLSFLPQVVKAWRTKSTKDLSIFTYLILSTGVFLWIIYGILINSIPIIIANSVMICLLLILVFLKLKYN